MIAIRAALVCALSFLSIGQLAAARVAFNGTGSNQYHYWLPASSADVTGILSAANAVTGGTKCPGVSVGADASGPILVIQCSSQSASWFSSKILALGYVIIRGGFPAFNTNLVPALSAAVGGGTVTLSVSSAAGNAWQATSNAPWLTLTSTLGTIVYAASVNDSAAPRTATISVAVGNGIGQFAITQAAGTATYSFVTSVATVGVAAGSGDVDLVVSLSDGPWTATSNQPWLTVSPPSGAGSGTITYSYEANFTNAARIATITVRNASFRVTQQAGKVTLVPTSVQAPQAGGSGGIAMTTSSADLPWKATSNASWLTVNPASGSGNATITYRFDPNPTNASRTGAISVNGVIVTITQPGVSISFSPSRLNVTGTSSAGTVNLTVGGSSTPWSMTGGAPWIALSPRIGVGSQLLSYSVALNDSLTARSTSVSVNGASLTVIQAGSLGSVTISPATAVAGPNVTTGSVTAVPFPSDYTTWTVTGAPDWLKLSFIGNKISWTANTNTGSLNRTAVLSIGGRAFTLLQSANDATNPLVSGVTSSASYAQGVVAPGQIVTIWGLTLGPAEPTATQFDANGMVATKNSETQVFFDAISAPIISAYAGQTTVQVPYQLVGKNSTSVTVQYKGVSSPPTPLTVSASAFGLFTSDASGKGQAAALNQDVSLNSDRNPVPRGEVIVLYGTGEGQTNPAGVEGIRSPLSPPWIAAVLPVSVLIGGEPAVIEFAGETPGQISGLFQINARVPDRAAVGPAVPVIVKVGQSSSQSGVTVAIK